MEPNTAQAAQAPPTADAPAADSAQVDDYGFPVAGDLSTDNMSDAELASFVDKSLGIKGGKQNETPPDTNKPTAPVTDPPPPPPPPEQPVVPSPGTGDQKPQPAPAPADTDAGAAAGTEPAPQLDTSDLWIEVENSDGEKVRISFDQGVPDDFTFKTDKQLYEVLDAMQEMKQLRNDRQAKVDKWQADQDAKTSETKAQESQMANWDAEINALIDSGILTAPKVTSDDPNFLKDPTVQKVDAVFKYMIDENAKRQEAGKPPIQSFGAAYTLYSNDAQVKQAAEADKQKNELAKRRGAIVGGSSAPTGSDKGYVYKRGSARNIWQVDTSDI